MRSSGGLRAASAGSLRVRWLLVVVGVIVLLTAGWPLLNTSISNRQRVAANSTLIVGPNHPNVAMVTLGRGWSLLADQTDPRQNYALRRGAIALKISFVTLMGGNQTAHLWAGLREVEQFNSPGISLTGPRPIRTGQGCEGETGSLAGNGMSGIATIVAKPSSNIAVEVIMLTRRPVSPVNLALAKRIIHSLRFTAAR